jgi:phage portal protein BeeE
MGAVVNLMRRNRATPAKLPPSSSASLAYYDKGRVGKSSVRLFRHWAEHSEWARGAINIRKFQVSTAKWDIVQFDNDGREPDAGLQADVKALFDEPNATTKGWREFVEAVMEDVLVLDAGVVEKVRTLRGDLVEMYAVDGGTIRVSTTWTGDPDEARYFWYPDEKERARFKDMDMLYMMMNPRSYTPIGLAPLETLKQTIDSELMGSEYNDRQVRGAAPDGMLDLGEGARPENVDAFKSYWAAEIEGKTAMAFIGGTKNARFIPFRTTNREMQFLEWQHYLVRKMALVFGLSPQDLTLTADVNRATADVQQENTEDRGFRPLLGLVQDYFTREIVWDPSFGGRDNNLAFRFTALNLNESTQKAQINKIALAGMPWRTVNEARRDEGRETLGPEYDQLMVVTPTGAVSLDAVPSAQEVVDAKNKPQLPAGGAKRE